MKLSIYNYLFILLVNFKLIFNELIDFDAVTGLERKFQIVVTLLKIYCYDEWLIKAAKKIRDFE